MAKKKKEKQRTTPHRVALLEVPRLPPEQRPPQRRVRKLERVQGRGRPLAPALAPAEELEQGGADAVAEVLEPDGGGGGMVFFFWSEKRRK